MNCKKWIFRLSLMLNVLAVVGILLIVLVFFWYNRPLRPTTEWLVQASTHAGKPVSVETYKTLGREMFFLRVDDADLGMVCHWVNPRWFVMDFPKNKEDVVVLIDPRMGKLFGRFLLLERLEGVDILDNVLKERWYLSYTGNSVVFSNRVLAVSATRKNPSPKTVEVHKNTWERVLANPPPPLWIPSQYGPEVSGYKLTLSDPYFDEDGWAVFINRPFRDSPDTNTVLHTASVVLTNTNDVRAEVSRTIYVELKHSAGVDFYVERVKTAEMDRHYLGSPTDWLHAERKNADYFMKDKKEKDAKLTVKLFYP